MYAKLVEEGVSEAAAKREVAAKILWKVYGAVEGGEERERNQR